jgi:AraC-like DNA-binding protein
MMGRMVTVARTAAEPAPASAGPAGLVEALWVARSAHGAPPRVALPDGRPAVVVRLGGPVRWVDPLTGTAEVIGSVLRGPRSVPRVVRAADPAAPAWEVGARLAPWALSAVHPADPLVDDHVALASALPDADALAARLRACWQQPGDPAARAARLLQEALVAALVRPVPAHDLADLARVVAVADAERGLLRPVDLARAVDRTPASLHALLADHLGVTPAAYLAAVRLAGAVRELGVDDRGDAARVAAVLRAYADAGHPPREVERFTGRTLLELERVVRGVEAVLRTV